MAQINQAWQSWQLTQIYRMEFPLKQQAPNRPARGKILSFPILAELQFVIGLHGPVPGFRTEIG